MKYCTVTSSRLWSTILHSTNLRATYWAKILTVYVRLLTTIENMAPRLVDNTRPCLDSTRNSVIIFRTGKVAGLSLVRRLATMVEATCSFHLCPHTKAWNIPIGTTNPVRLSSNHSNRGRRLPTQIRVPLPMTQQAQLILCVRTSNHDSLSNLNHVLQTNILRAYWGTYENIQCLALLHRFSLTKITPRWH
jgi:hypothetical protein